MSEKLTEEELVDELANIKMIFKSGSSAKKAEQAYTQIKKMIENYDEVQAFAMEIIEGKCITLAEIRELSVCLRDTSRQTLYETKLRRWLESKGFVVEEN